MSPIIKSAGRPASTRNRRRRAPAIPARIAARPLLAIPLILGAVELVPITQALAAEKLDPAAIIGLWHQENLGDPRYRRTIHFEPGGELGIGGSTNAFTVVRDGRAVAILAELSDGSARYRFEGSLLVFDHAYAGADTWILHDPDRPQGATSEWLDTRATCAVALDGDRMVLSRCEVVSSDPGRPPRILPDMIWSRAPD